MGEVTVGAREAWLERLCEKLRPVIDATGDYSVPLKVRISTGFPSVKALARRGKALGECWLQEAADDKLNQIFISPLLAEPVEVAKVTLHELCHTATPGEAHKGKFVKLMKLIGFVAPWTSSVASEELEGRLRAIVEGLGPYPHARLRPLSKLKKQRARLLKLSCPTCGYTLRGTRKWIDARVPICANKHDAVDFLLEEQESGE